MDTRDGGVGRYRPSLFLGPGAGHEQELQARAASLSKQKGSKIAFLCPSKCHLCTQGRASQGKSKAKYDPWGGAENLSSGRDRAGRQWQRRLSTQQQLPLCRSAQPSWGPLLWALPSAHSQKEDAYYHLHLPSSTNPLDSDAWIFVAVAS